MQVGLTITPMAYDFFGRSFLLRYWRGETRSGCCYGLTLIGLIFPGNKQPFRARRTMCF